MRPVINQKEVELILISSWGPMDSSQHQLRSGTVLSSLSLFLADLSLWLVSSVTETRHSLSQEFCLLSSFLPLFLPTK